jgi:hypothetical protein
VLQLLHLSVVILHREKEVDIPATTLDIQGKGSSRIKKEYMQEYT